MKVKCKICEGTGSFWNTCGSWDNPSEDYVDCSECEGSGEVEE